MAFASQETVQVLATKEELDALESAYEEDVSNKLSIFGIPESWIESDEEKVLVMKQMLIDLRKATFEVCLFVTCYTIGYIKGSEGTWRIWEAIQAIVFPCEAFRSERSNQLEELLGLWIDSWERGNNG